jgi:ATP-binding cassette subfamily F protein uup
MRYGERVLIDKLTTTILRGDKIGLIGPNGCGKTTLLKLILGQLQPTSGTIKLGSNLNVAYFDQMRAGLKLDATLADTISPGSEWIEIGSTRKHIMSYLGDFLFAPERANAKVVSLSGGERNRLLLARLFALPANVLVLDEPTNDLDIDTLELLEELLANYPGTVFLVSHDRRFVDNVVTSTLVWEGDVSPGLWREYEGNVEDWQAQRARVRANAPAPARTPAPAPALATPTPPAPVVARPRAKLSYKEQRELDELPAKLEALESEQKTLEAEMATPAFYTQAKQVVADKQARFGLIEEQLMAMLERWEALSQK